MAKAKKTKSKPSSIVTFLLDRSSSMSTIKSSTIEAFNTYLKTLQDAGTPINFSLLQFDSESLDKTHVNVPVKDAVPLTNLTYLPRASTPLIDAAYKTIKAVEGHSGLTKKTKVVICIQTDGEENCSSQYNWEQLHTLIQEKIKLGWEFNFMGAGINAYQQGVKMGISVQNTVSYDSARPEMALASFSASASNTAGFASGKLRSTAYSMQQKTASGDKYDPSLTGGVVITSTSKQPAMSSIKPATKEAVSDFTL